MKKLKMSTKFWTGLSIFMCLVSVYLDLFYLPQSEWWQVRVEFASEHFHNGIKLLDLLVTVIAMLSIITPCLISCGLLIKWITYVGIPKFNKWLNSLDQ